MDLNLGSLSEQRLIGLVAAIAGIVSSFLAIPHLWDHRDWFGPIDTIHEGMVI